jgi:hypothetical protein
MSIMTVQEAKAAQPPIEDVNLLQEAMRVKRVVYISFQLKPSIF